MAKSFRLYQIPLFFAIVSLAFYFSFAYSLERHDFFKLISLYAGLFILAYLFIEKWRQNFGILVGIGISFRLLFLFALPNLSQDFYRFIWDGHLMAQGVNPYIFSPQMFFNDLSISEEIIIPNANQLYSGMGTLSASHFSNYPPLNQFFFALGTLIGGKGILGPVIVYRIIIILADIGILYFAKKLLKKFKLSTNTVFWYFLNPFIIIELTGNLHFEGVMLFFLIWGLYLLFEKKWILSGIIIGLSISVKLIPLLFLPLLYRYFVDKEKVPKVFESLEISARKLSEFYLIIGATAIFTFLPFFTFESFHNFYSTIALWFQNFEFNASIYYIIRWIGYQIMGYNIIGTVGKILPALIFIGVLAIAYLRMGGRRRQLFTSMLFAISLYFLLSTTVHPWYIATPLLLCLFTHYRFPVVWSFMIMLSYSAYGPGGTSENYWLIALEYIVVIGYATWEIYDESVYPSTHPSHIKHRNAS